MIEILAVKSLYPYKVIIKLICWLYELQTHDMIEILKSQLTPQEILDVNSLHLFNVAIDLICWLCELETYDMTENFKSQMATLYILTTSMA